MCDGTGITDETVSHEERALTEKDPAQPKTRKEYMRDLMRKERAMLKRAKPVLIGMADGEPSILAIDEELCVWMRGKGLIVFQGEMGYTITDAGRKKAKEGK